MATCVDLSKAEYPKEVKGQKIVPLQGVSLKPSFSGKNLQRKNPIYWEHEGNRAIRIGKWKLVAKGANGAWELYDLDADRSELYNLATVHEDRAKEMADKWEAWAIEAKAKPWPWNRKKNSFSKKKVFNLAPDANLPMGDSPMIAKKAFEVEVQIEKQEMESWSLRVAMPMDGGSRLKTELLSSSYVWAVKWKPYLQKKNLEKKTLRFR